MSTFTTRLRSKNAHTSGREARCAELVFGFEHGNVLAVEHVPLGDGYALLAHERQPTDILDVPEIGPFLSAHAGQSWIVVPDDAGVEHVSSQGTRGRDTLSTAGELTPSHEITRASLMRVPDEGTVHVRHAGLMWSVRAVDRAPAPAKAPISFTQHRWTLASAAFHGVMLASFLLAAPTSRGLCMDGLVRDDLRLISTALLAVEQQASPLPEVGESGGRDGQPHTGDEGSAGDPKAPRTTHRGGTKKAAEKPELALSSDSGAVANAGILGVLASAAAKIDSPSSPYGGPLPSGYDDANALGALLGAQLGANFGNGGLGMRDAGRGGGGDGLGTIGVGKLGTIGGYGRNGDDHGYGTAQGGLGGRVAKVPQIHGGSGAEVRGGLSKETIRRVIQRHLNEVRFCYEQGLAGKPDLAGRVQVQFVIAPSGAVSASNVSQSSLSAPETAACIRDAVRRWAFPAPDGGGVVIVSYPFLLESAG